MRFIRWLYTKVRWMLSIRSAPNRMGSDGMSIFVHGLRADLGSGEQRVPFLSRVVQIAIAPMAKGNRRTNDRDRGGIDFRALLMVNRSEGMRGAGFEPANPYGTGS